MGGFAKARHCLLGKQFFVQDFKKRILENFGIFLI
jgi:hypothetical protein